MIDKTQRHPFSSRVKRDIVATVVVLLLGTSLSHRYDLFERFAEWSAAHEAWQVDELAVISMFLVGTLFAIAWRRWRDAARESAVHRSTAEQLRTSEERFRQAFESAPAGVALIGVEDGRFLRVNRAVCDMLGYDSDELSTMSIHDVVHPEDRDTLAISFREAIAGGAPSSRARMRYLRNGASTAHVVVSMAAVHDTTGQPIHVVAHAIDVTEQENAQQRLIRTLASKDELIASIAHEIRTPLTAVVGYADLLRDDTALSPGERDEMIHAIVEQSSDLTNIVEDLLVAAKIDADSLNVAPISVDLRAQAVHVLDPLRHLEATNRFTFTGDSVQAYGEPARVRQIIRNLVTNAIRYGGSDINISFASDDSLACVAVSDDGPGIPHDQSATIFEPYQSAHMHEGLTASVGLGLTISRRLARLMDGDLTYRRHNGRSIFEFALPAATPASNKHTAGATQGIGLGS